MPAYRSEFALWSETVSPPSPLEQSSGSAASETFTRDVHQRRDQFHERAARSRQLNGGGEARIDAGFAGIIQQQGARSRELPNQGLEKLPGHVLTRPATGLARAKAR